MCRNPVDKVSLTQAYLIKDLHRLETKLLEKQQKRDEFLERQKRMAKIKEKVLQYIVSREKHGLNLLTYCSFLVSHVTCVNLHGPALHLPRPQRTGNRAR